MKYTIYGLPMLFAIFLLIIFPFAFAAKNKTVEKTPLQEIAQEGIQPEGMPVILEDGQTRENYYKEQEKQEKQAKQTKPMPKKTTAPKTLGVIAPKTVTATPPVVPVTPVEAPKLPSTPVSVPTIVYVPTPAPQTVTATVTPQPAPVEELPLAFDVNFRTPTSLFVQTNQAINPNLITFSGAVTFVSAVRFPDAEGTTRQFRNTHLPAWLYEVQIEGMENRVPFNVTVKTATQSVSRETELNMLSF